MSADHEYRARFSREADLASTLWHPHIVSVHDRGEQQGQLWISMDYVDGFVPRLSDDAAERQPHRSRGRLEQVGSWLHSTGVAQQIAGSAAAVVTAE